MLSSEDHHERDGGAGSSTRVVTANAARTTTVVEIGQDQEPRRAPVSCRTRRWPEVTSVKTTRATALPMDAIADRSKNDRQDDGGDGRDDDAGRGAAAHAPAQQRRELADRGHLLAQPGGGEETGVGRAGRGEQRRDAHHPVAGRPSIGSAATASAVPPDAITSSTVSVPNTPSATAT